MIRMMTGLCNDLASTSLRTRITVVFSFLIVGNALAWGLALAAFHHEPVLLGTAFLAWVLGLRHAIDPDHIAARSMRTTPMRCWRGGVFWRASCARSLH